VTLQDSQLCTYQDLGTQFFLRLQDVKESKNRLAFHIVRSITLIISCRICYHLLTFSMCGISSEILLH